MANVVDRLMRYHDYGQYDYQIRQVANAAREYLLARVNARQGDEKLAAVFDIDETSLSNWETLSACGFCAYSAQLKLYPQPPAHDPAIQPTRELYQFAQTLGVAVFFVTGREVKERASTEANLTEAGYTRWDGLYMQPDTNTDPAGVFKPRNRQQIQAKGYRIVLNIGDQPSDLSGCCSERVFKLPNPFYLIK